MRRVLSFLLVPLLVPLTTGDASAALDDATRVENALRYMASKQNVTGRWDLRSDGLPTQGYVTETLASAGLDAKAWPTRELSAYLALRPESGAGATAPADAADRIYKSVLRIAYASAVAGYDPRALNGLDAVTTIREGFVGSQFGDPRYINDDAWAILALRAAGVPREDPQIRAAVDLLLRARTLDGGWGYAPITTAKGDIDSTGMVLVALKAAGEPVERDEAARAFVARQVATQGGFRASGADYANCQSTAWGIHASSALGLPTPAHAMEFLRALQRPDGGFWTSKETNDRVPSNLFCTVEATLVLAGARHPLPGFAPTTGEPTPVRAVDRVRPALPGPFHHVDWTWEDDRVRQHGDGSLTFPHAGEYAYRVYARGEGVVHRSEGTLTVLSARPLLDARLSATDVPRNVSVELDATGSTDPDGRPVRLVVEWGDGAHSESDSLRASHAYASLGTFALRAFVVDDAGVSSVAFAGAVTVRNRAPLFGAVPPHLIADRSAALALPWNASDPDGDPVTLTWRVDNRSGSEPFASFDTLGARTLRLAATDPSGATAETEILVEVRNLPPELSDLRLPSAPRSDEPFGYGVAVRDADGPEPQVSWRFGNLTRVGANGTLSLPAGRHDVVVTARDAEGEERRMSTFLLVGEGERRAPPAPENLTARLAQGRLAVAFAPPPGDVRALVRWQSEAGSGEAEAAAGALEVPLAATEARVLVVFVRDGVESRAEARAEDAGRAPLAASAVRVPADVVAGREVSLRAQPVPEAEAYRFEFGDGAQRDWAPEAEARHAWGAPGVYEVRVHARASDGRTSVSTRLVEVAAPPVPTPVAPAIPSPAPPEATPAEAPPVQEATSPDLTEAEVPRVEPQAPRKESPAPLPWGALLLALLLPRLGRRAASGPPRARRARR